MARENEFLFRANDSTLGLIKNTPSVYDKLLLALKRSDKDKNIMSLVDAMEVFCLLPESGFLENNSKFLTYEIIEDGKQKKEQEELDRSEFLFLKGLFEKYEKDRHFIYDFQRVYFLKKNFEKSDKSEKAPEDTVLKLFDNMHDMYQKETLAKILIEIKKIPFQTFIKILPYFHENTDFTASVATCFLEHNKMSFEELDETLQKIPQLEQGSTRAFFASLSKSNETLSQMTNEEINEILEKCYYDEVKESVLKSFARSKNIKFKEAIEASSNGNLQYYFFKYLIESNQLSFEQLKEGSKHFNNLIFPSYKLVLHYFIKDNPITNEQLIDLLESCEVKPKAKDITEFCLQKNNTKYEQAIKILEFSDNYDNDELAYYFIKNNIINSEKGIIEVLNIFNSGKRGKHTNYWMLTKENRECEIINVFIKYNNTTIIGLINILEFFESEHSKTFIKEEFAKKNSIPLDQVNADIEKQSKLKKLSEFTSRDINSFKSSQENNNHPPYQQDNEKSEGSYSGSNSLRQVSSNKSIKKSKKQSSFRPTTKLTKTNSQEFMGKDKGKERESPRR